MEAATLSRAKMLALVSSHGEVYCKSGALTDLIGLSLEGPYRADITGAFKAP